VPQLEKYAFFTQLFWFFLFFSVFLLVLLQKILPAIARNLKFRQKLLKHYKKAAASTDFDTFLKEHNQIMLNTLDTTNESLNKAKILIKSILEKNLATYFRSTYFLKVSLFTWKQKQEQIQKKKTARKFIFKR
jgi:hypothetical protein